MSILKSFLIIILLFSITETAYSKRPVKDGGGTTEEVARGFLTYIPQSLPNEPVPLVVVLHGGYGNAEDMQKVMLMDKFADFKKFIIIYPQGTEEKDGSNQRTWNAGTCCGKAFRNNVDDVAFLDKLITEMKTNYNIDNNKIYILGHSNGAMMGYRFVCEKPGTVKSLVSLSGTILVDSCQSNNQLSVKEIHGEIDTIIKPEGNNSGRGLHYPSVEESGNIIKNAGASFESLILQNTGHAIVEIQKNYYDLYSKLLPSDAYEFMEGN